VPAGRKGIKWDPCVFNRKKKNGKRKAQDLRGTESVPQLGIGRRGQKNKAQRKRSQEEKIPRYSTSLLGGQTDRRHNNNKAWAAKKKKTATEKKKTRMIGKKKLPSLIG